MMSSSISAVNELAISGRGCVNAARLSEEPIQTGPRYPEQTLVQGERKVAEREGGGEPCCALGHGLIVQLSAQSIGPKKRKRNPHLPLF